MTRDPNRLLALVLAVLASTTLSACSMLEQLGGGGDEENDDTSSSFAMTRAYSTAIEGLEAASVADYGTSRALAAPAPAVLACDPASGNFTGCGTELTAVASRLLAQPLDFVGTDAAQLYGSNFLYLFHSRNQLLCMGIHAMEWNFDESLLEDSGFPGDGTYALDLSDEDLQAQLAEDCRMSSSAFADLTGESSLFVVEVAPTVDATLYDKKVSFTIQVDGLSVALFETLVRATDEEVRLFVRQRLAIGTSEEPGDGTYNFLNVWYAAYNSATGTAHFEFSQPKLMDQDVNAWGIRLLVDAVRSSTPSAQGLLTQGDIESDYGALAFYGDSTQVALSARGAFDGVFEGWDLDPWSTGKADCFAAGALIPGLSAPSDCDESVVSLADVEGGDGASPSDPAILANQFRSIAFSQASIDATCPLDESLQATFEPETFFSTEPILCDLPIVR